MHIKTHDSPVQKKTVHISEDDIDNGGDESDVDDDDANRTAENDASVDICLNQDQNDSIKLKQISSKKYNR